MKKLTLTLALILSTIMSFSQTKDSEGHVLASLWKTYYKADEADKPQDAAAALAAIKQEASQKHLPWDFYDAAQRYVSVRSSINWKDAPSLRNSMEKEVDEFPEPVLAYYHRRSQWSQEMAEKYVREHKDALLASSNPEFWKRDGYLTRHIYSDIVLKGIKNDYEYVVWSLYGNQRGSLVREYYSGRYPESAFIEYTDITRMNSDAGSYSKLGAYVNKYSDKAVSMLARQWRLGYDLRQLRRDDGSTSSDYEDMRDRCLSFRKDKARFSGGERQIADCCTEVDGILEELNSKDIDVNISGSLATVSLRNVKTAVFKVLSGGKTLWSSDVVNKKGSYYLRDKVEVRIPDINDGTYDIECTAAGADYKGLFAKYTLSVAVRAINEGYGAFVADYRSGEPVRQCDFILSDADGKKIATAEGVALDGFTTLPEKIQSHLLKDSYRNMQLSASYTDGAGRLHLSEPIGVNSPNPGKVTPAKNYASRRAVVLTDRGAYNPGETLHFKAVLYTGTYSYDLYPAGREIKAELFDTQGNSLASATYRTNEFGSVNGAFSLSGGSRGGMYSLTISENGSDLATRRVRVDEFVLPTFELSWDDDDTLYLPGDEVTVAGRVRSYSGHNLGDVRAEIDVQGVVREPLQLRPDGTFSYSFLVGPTPSRYGFPVTVIVTDATGETLEFNTYKQVNYRIPLSAELKNTVPGRFSLFDSNYYGSGWITGDDFARFEFSTGGLKRKGLELFYEIKNEAGASVLKGTAEPNSTLDLDLSGKPSGLYTIVVKASARRSDGELATNDATYQFIKAGDADTALDLNATSFFKEVASEGISLQFGATSGPVWAVVELVGSGNVLLEHQIVALKGERGKAGSLVTVSYPRKDDYPESLTLSVLYFRDGGCFSYSRTIKLPVKAEPLPLRFTRFTDLARPGEKTSMLIQTEPGVECAAAIFDKATEEIQANPWSRVTPHRLPEPRVYYSSVCGSSGTRYPIFYGYEDGAVPLMKSAAAGRDAREALGANLAVEEAAMAQERPEIRVRDNFDATMAWEPCLQSDEKGQIEFTFTGSDRLSTYYVQLFAHTSGMRNETLRQEMKVSIPVKVSLAQPLFLYGGDSYVARASVSSSLEEPVSGRVSIRLYDGADYKTAAVLAGRTEKVSLPAGGSIPFSIPFDVPADKPVLGIMVDFVADNAEYGSDAVFVTVPCKVALQTLTEAHSAVLLAGMDRDALVAGLRSQFVNADASALVPVERDILGMIRETIPDSIEPKCDNIIALTEAYYANVLARRVGADGLPDADLASMREKIAACQTSTGGLSWFEGMSSSLSVTAAVLQRIAAMPEARSLGIDVERAVGYLDKAYFEKEDRPWFFGGISLAVYLQTRALYPQVPFSKPDTKAFRAFKKSVREYLTPSKRRSFNGQILAKARRLRTLQSLLTLDGGKTLAKSWGLSLCSRVSRSYDADVESLLQYAVAHRCGGNYYPNAVMPWRGLLESELYAHALLCDLFTGVAERAEGKSGKPVSYAAAARNTAEGVRLWIMIQKETQHWENDSAYIEAIASVLRGTPETLATKVILLSTTFTKPFPEVKASGNGFRVEREFSVDGRVLSEGDTLHVGDKVLARYKIWSEENRSFVRLTAPRPASMRPVEQLSGHIGWMFRPMSYGAWSFSPQGYRNVLSDKTEYWFDSYPEESTVLREEFFVSQEGSFQMPAVEIESLYAPHYRANDDGRGPLVSD